ncbi:MAG: hypothetical protein ACP5GS_00175 [Nitrososphaeria archaeon]
MRKFLKTSEHDLYRLMLNPEKRLRSGKKKKHASQEKTSGCKNFELELDKTGSQIAG